MTDVYTSELPIILIPEMGADTQVFDGLTGIVSGGGHLISVSHSEEVCDFLVNTIRTLCVQ